MPNSQLSARVRIIGLISSFVAVVALAVTLLAVNRNVGLGHSVVPAQVSFLLAGAVLCFVQTLLFLLHGHSNQQALLVTHIAACGHVTGRDDESMNSEITHQILRSIEVEVHSQPTVIEFEMAYQVRVAIDRIKFAIKHIEGFGPRTDQMCEAALQLLHALHRLETVDRRFQERSQVGPQAKAARTESANEGGNEQQRKPLSHGPTSATCGRFDGPGGKAKD